MLIHSLGDAANKLGNFLLTFGSWGAHGHYVEVTSTRHGIMKGSWPTRDGLLIFPAGDRKYTLGPCDADALAGCVNDAGAGTMLVDLDEASFDSFQRFKGNQSRLLLYYEPSFLDRYFVAGTDSNASLSKDGMTLEIGLVNCNQNPNLCMQKDISNGPSLRVLYPQDVRARASMYRHKRGDGDRVLSYSAGVKECLWKRYGAGSLTNVCSSDLVNGQSGVSLNTSFIKEGRKIAWLWNGLVILACLVLLTALCLAGWKLLKRCLARCFGFDLGAVARSSVSMSKQERQKQLEQQLACFHFAALTLCLTNMFLPAVTLLVAGPIAIGTLVWLCCVEFKCKTRRLTDYTKPSEVCVDDEKQEPLISEVAVV